MAPPPPSPPRAKGRRGSTTEDLVAWHGMSVKNFTTMVAGGLPHTLRRRALWMDIISTEVKTRSKAKMSQGFISFVASTAASGSPTAPTQAMVAPAPGDVSILSSRRLRPERSSTLLDDKHMVELVSELKDSKFVFIDHTLAPFVLGMSQILLPELHTRSELIKILTFILHREQLPHNDRAILPYGDTTPICVDTFEAVLQTLNPKIYNKILTWRLPRVELFMNLLMVAFSGTFPAALKLRAMDHILVNGCVGLASIALAYLHRRSEHVLRCVSGDAFYDLREENAAAWLAPAQVDEFWKECADMHKSHFLHMYSHRAVQMRAMHMTFNAADASDKYLPDQHLQFAFSSYDWIGFNVDHALAEYKTEMLLKTSFERAYTKIQSVYLNLKTNTQPTWHPPLAHRGLAIDRERGNFLLFGSNGDILGGFHGTTEIPLHQLNWQYPLARRDETDWLFVYTVPEMIYPQLFAWLIDHYEHGSITDDDIGYVHLNDQVLHEMEFILPKSAFSVLSTIAFEAATAYYEADFLPTLVATPEVLLHYNANIRVTLEHVMTVVKKRMFILTNSSWEHTNAVLQYSIGKDWVHFFDIVVTKCVPSIFYDPCNTRRFMELPLLHGSRTLVPMTTPMLERGHVYAGGNVKDLMATLGPTAKVCYVGDHLLHDILLPTENFVAPWDVVAIGHLTAQQVQNFMWSFFFPSSTKVEARCKPTGPFFYLDVGGVFSYWGKKINEACVLCVDSVGRLGDHDMSVASLVQARLDRRRDSIRTRASTTATSSAITTYDKLANIVRPNKVTTASSLTTAMSMHHRSENPAMDRRSSLA
ncbi:hypothetical protein ACHHYP_03058 [Achlya hypogyna]|uniref:Rab-GAP TBC domain-containing protein n=1 Tax=Achlya hypogyna TaxID=1202772 RepID=A0A1V9Z4T3_ACHHY|nr:hypothetical protein ACHHYP_03058 [Achlya hypogyna]